MGKIFKCMFLHMMEMMADSSVHSHTYTQRGGMCFVCNTYSLITVSHMSAHVETPAREVRKDSIIPFLPTVNVI